MLNSWNLSCYSGKCQAWAQTLRKCLVQVHLSLLPLSVLCLQNILPHKYDISGKDHENMDFLSSKVLFRQNIVSLKHYYRHIPPVYSIFLQINLKNQ